MALFQPRLSRALQLNGEVIGQNDDREPLHADRPLSEEQTKPTAGNYFVGNHAALAHEIAFEADERLLSAPISTTA